MVTIYSHQFLDFDGNIGKTLFATFQGQFGSLTSLMKRAKVPLKLKFFVGIYTVKAKNPCEHQCG